MRLLIKENPRTLALVSKTHVLLFRHIRTKNNLPRCVIEFSSIDEINLQSYKKITNKEIHGFLGLIEVNNDSYLCAITGKHQVASPIPGETVNKIFSVDFFSLTSSTWDNVDLDPNGYPVMPDFERGFDDQYRTGTINGGNSGSAANQDTALKHPCFELQKLLSTGGFYYSSNFDLTSTLQDRGVDSHSLSFDSYNEEYMWNSFMLHEVVQFRNRLDTPLKQKLDDEGFLTTVIRGFAETFDAYLGREQVAMTVISRQSWKRAGTRFNSRGIDDEGNVANFVETEFILYSGKICYSYTEIRGSVPIFWEQDTALINPKVQITRSEEATQPVFDAHFDHLLEKYGAVNIVNLLSTKTSEIQLSKRYRSHVNTYTQNNNPELYLTEFDFHRETSNQGYSSSTKILRLIKESLYEFGYFSYDVVNKKILSEQNGTFRTNCLDCLDRTNLIQQYISNFALSVFLKDHDFQVSPESEFFNRHNSLWADNGDQISQIYTGTNALKSSFSRSGKMSFAGALSDATKSVSRMYINNFVDKGKQLTIDTLLGRLSSQVPVLLYDPVTDYVNEKLKEQKDEFTSSANINIFTGTFNVNASNRIPDLSSWLYPIGDKFKPNVVVLGFQEVIELTAGSILNADYSKSSFWTKEVSKCLNQFDKYILLRAEQMSSLLLLFFVKADCVNNVKQVEGATKKTGLGGITGNKGAVAIRFNYGASSFCFVNAHLAAGTTNVQERANDYASITNGIRFSRGGKIESNDTIFWIGDLNYRISLSNEEVRKRIANCDIEYLYQFDQLTKEINSGNAFKGYSEPTISFNPTYKFDKGTDRYDSSEKQRIPSWTDRIIYKGKATKPLAYSSSDLTFSDHRPVYAAYRSIVDFIDEIKKSSLSKQIYENYKATHAGDSDSSLIDLKFENNNEDQKPVKTSSSRNQDLLNFLDDEDDYKPSLPIRRQTASPISSEILTPRKQNSPTPPPALPARRAVTNVSSTISTPAKNLQAPPPPAPRSTTPLSTKPPSSSQSKETPSTSVSPPPAPTPRKTNASSSSLPPGFSDTILLPSKTPSRVSSPSNNGKAQLAPTIPKKPVSLGSSPAPSIPKKPEFLHSSTTSNSKTNVPSIPKKPDSLRKVSTEDIENSKITNESEEKTSEVPSNSSAPPPPPSRKGTALSFNDSLDMNSWKPLKPT
ncbi:hypothetical protein BN7_615 [Wickerhamomyces ciferrii]|uniref:phosphoinositide 5-phosphatase n=1 Tax=Wickerhamomyces ciferrii (strain ATCC 14091 / BCRC 22168 / CBS 111 / JCM 3599 / NBRC 0793 / NRRL Y-1031 F-60-10) TaxID=1206466 RepID=K0KIW2_WICCF|nr:uncharacterized protein BN7_615 [Wickerhamomyces ciferrii]CCH41078.1 hypothetical protein BN7_615 [Wickerhamomyces ciferrii]